MFTITGYSEGVPFRVEVDPEAETPVSGYKPLEHLLALKEGQSFPTSVTGDDVTLDMSNGASILAALRSLADVRQVEGDLPEDPAAEDGDYPEDAVF